MKITPAMKKRIFEALGSASICWNPRPTGIFDSSLVAQIGEELCQDLAEDETEHVDIPVGDAQTLRGDDLGHESSLFGPLGGR